MATGFTKISSGIEDQLKGMVDRSRDMTSYLNRVVYQQYKNAQRQRWITEGSSEGPKWKALNKGYAKSKLTRFASYPGGGRHILIATGELQKSVIGPGGGHRKIVTDHSIEINWTTDYADKVNDVRPFSAFGNKTNQEIYDGIAKFLISGLMRSFGK